eukprot:snap_masked-scaffold_9-processed-gene-13.36-mRNA-1 protein AED:1.00 eAED:1.00 QI:0/-1/0/0/-1/1/1/0/372
MSTLPKIISDILNSDPSKPIPGYLIHSLTQSSYNAIEIDISRSLKLLETALLQSASPKRIDQVLTATLKISQNSPNSKYPLKKSNLIQRIKEYQSYNTKADALVGDHYIQKIRKEAKEILSNVFDETKVQTKSISSNELKSRIQGFGNTNFNNHIPLSSRVEPVRNNPIERFQVKEKTKEEFIREELLTVLRNGMYSKEFERFVSSFLEDNLTHLSNYNSFHEDLDIFFKLVFERLSISSDTEKTVCLGLLYTFLSIFTGNKHKMFESRLKEKMDFIKSIKGNSEVAEKIKNILESLGEKEVKKPKEEEVGDLLGIEEPEEVQDMFQGMKIKEDPVDDLLNLTTSKENQSAFDFLNEETETNKKDAFDDLLS